jgi:hypothetical protein
MHLQVVTYRLIAMGAPRVDKGVLYLCKISQMQGMHYVHNRRNKVDKNW